MMYGKENGMKVDNIAGLCYELYKLIWLRMRTTPEMQMDALKDWYEEEFQPQYSVIPNAYTGEADGYYGGLSFEEWVMEHGYQGKGCYASFREFMTNEFLDKGQMKRLLDNDALYSLYLQYMKEVA